MHLDSFLVYSQDIDMNKHSFSFLALPFTLLLLQGCSTASPRLPPETREDEIGMETRLEDLEHFVVLGLGDLHGFILPDEHLGIVGADFLVGKVQEFQNKYDNRLLVVDAGDQWHGSLESHLKDGEPVLRILNRMNLRASVLGDAEFAVSRLNQDPARSLLKQANFPILATNLVSSKTKKLPWLLSGPRLKARSVVELGEGERTVRVGIVGVLGRSLRSQIHQKFLGDLTLLPPAKALIEEAKQLRSLGVEMVIALAHMSLDCRTSEEGHPLSKVWKPSSIQSACLERSELAKTLNQLPPGTLDAVVAGHSHQIAHHWINGIPVIESGSKGRYFQLIHLVWDRRQKRVLPQLTRIEGPIDVSTASPDTTTEEELVQLGRDIQGVREKIIGFASRPISHLPEEESPMGNLLSDAMKVHTHADFAVFPPFGVASSIHPGRITYGDLFRSLPYGARISVLQLTGSELRKLIGSMSSGVGGFYAFAGLKMKLLDLQYKAPVKDQNGDHRISPWEMDRVLELRQSDGSPIQPGEVYTLAVPDFLVSGSSRLKVPFQKIPRKRMNKGGSLLQAVIQYLSSRGPINTASNPLVNPEEPRLILTRSVRME